MLRFDALGGCCFDKCDGRGCWFVVVAGDELGHVFLCLSFGFVCVWCLHVNHDGYFDCVVWVHGVHGGGPFVI